MNPPQYAPITIDEDPRISRNSKAFAGPNGIVEFWANRTKDFGGPKYGVYLWHTDSYKEDRLPYLVIDKKSKNSTRGSPLLYYTMNSKKVPEFTSLVDTVHSGGDPAVFFDWMMEVAPYYRKGRTAVWSPHEYINYSETRRVWQRKDKIKVRPLIPIHFVACLLWCVGVNFAHFQHGEPK